MMNMHYQNLKTQYCPHLKAMRCGTGRWLSHVQVDCYNHLSTPIFQSVLKDTTYNEQR